MLEKLTEEHTTINLFKFVINPNDFAQSVENIFHLSFLIRDGVCALDIQDGEPMICAHFSPFLRLHDSHTQTTTVMCEAPSDADYADGLKKQQMILQFDIDTWKVRPVSHIIQSISSLRVNFTSERSMFSTLRNP